MTNLKSKYETVIGLEVHAQLKTKAKIFCGSATEFGKQHNSQICPICAGYPGVLPVLNKEVVNFAILTGLALNCEVSRHSKFDRKQYFYPDLPKNYQISQYDMPIAKNGWIKIGEKKIRINRVHLEEDAGKLVHAGAAGLAGSTYSLVDYNRTGVPLLEIVSEADISSPEEARAYMEELRNVVRYLDVCDGNLEEGSLRCDANVSIRLIGQKEFGTKAEIKNMNSFRALQKALEYEVERQTELVDKGERIIQETRLWNEAEGITVSMRSKEEAHDYRYFPEPDLVPLEIGPDWIDKLKVLMPELPEQKRQRYICDLGLSEYDASVIVESLEMARFFDKVAELGANIKTAANWLMGDITAYLKEKKISIQDTKLTPENLAEMLQLIDKGVISNNIAKKMITPLIEKGDSPRKLVEEQGVSVITDESAIREIIKKVLDNNASEVQKYKSGKPQLFGFFVGQVMKETKGRAQPETVNKIIKEELEK
ncbi:MAG: aspartyl/glutamyl-tRNA amidotransferase subunit B [Candidatus Melainabacteria bacterium RIFOXYA12_FULL_32_12]|nr:MAG: aspartyl/glutamyl-tRNA amidotransferase subunit B [Candidatus Melainabacteria bacterium RIFOXYA2_FULL_32_9]OGI28040.1 MAG: aspartyl/glutamyl-tRNA amidotransferase subunit B [Candidatus Melainabacteria bacterium RIFOXYA12_FULL_32_12]